MSRRRQQLFGALLFLLLGVGLLLDLRTDRELVMATLYAVPVALSSLLRSNRLTLSVISGALAATLGVGFENLFNTGVADAPSAFALLNRLLAALSFTLVGVFIIVLNRSRGRVTRLEHEGERAEREAELRHLLTELSHADTPAALLSAAAEGVRRLFGATRVVISGAREGRLSAPHVAAPSAGDELGQGRVTPWVATLPTTTPRVASARVDGKLLTAGWLRRGGGRDDLLIFISGAVVREPCVLLSEVIDGLEPLLEHAERLEGAAPPQRQRAVLS